MVASSLVDLLSPTGVVEPGDDGLGGDLGQGQGIALNLVDPRVSLGLEGGVSRGTPIDQAKMLA